MSEITKKFFENQIEWEQLKTLARLVLRCQNGVLKLGYFKNVWDSEQEEWVQSFQVITEVDIDPNIMHGD